MKFIYKILKVPIRFFRSLYAWTTHWAKSPHAPIALFGVTFIESSFFPIPPDVLLVAMTATEPKKWIRNAAICTIGSVLGALFGYLIGWCFYESAGKIIINAYHLQPIMDIVGAKYQQNAFLTVFTAAFTPIPYKVITIAAGLFRISIVVLIIASIIGRAGRFFLVAGALRIFGEKIEKTIEKYFDIFSIVFVILLVAGFIAIKYLK